MMAINSYIEVNITSQICSDSIGTKMYSSFDGQLDFIMGVAMSEDRQRKLIIALQSVMAKEHSKIQPFLTLRECISADTLKCLNDIYEVETVITRLWQQARQLFEG